MAELSIAMLLFVGTHFLMSHPLRAPIVSRLGERGFQGVYSLVALATLIWAVRAWNDAPAGQLWFQYFEVGVAAHLAMIVALILLTGSVMAPNPALAGAEGALAKVDEPRGVMKVTRHPMMWGIAIWAFVHIVTNADPGTLVFGGGIAILALVGAAAQDMKKRRLIGAAWSDYAVKTSYWPKLWRWVGLGPLIAGIALYALLIWAHPLLFGQTTRLWEFFL
ncbi:MAG: NnrU family protein [Pseudomonadota bacterium]